MLNLENRTYSIEEPRRTDVFESVSSIPFPSEDEIEALKQGTACLVLPTNPGRVIKIAEQWKEVKRRKPGETKATAMDAVERLFDNTFPAFSANADDISRISASRALREPVLDLAQSGRCSGGRLNIEPRS